MGVQNIANKYRRALRNGTGATFSLDQLRELAGHGVLELIARIEAQELCPVTRPPTLLEPIGSIAGGMAKRLTSGKLPQPANDQSFIAALTAGA